MAVFVIIADSELQCMLPNNNNRLMQGKRNLSEAASTSTGTPLFHIHTTTNTNNNIKHDTT